MTVSDNVDTEYRGDGVWMNWKVGVLVYKTS